MLRFEVPVHAVLDAVFEPYAGLPPQEPVSLRYIRPGFFDISDVEGLVVNLCFFPEKLLDHLNDREEVDRVFAAAEVNNLVAYGLECRDGAASDVVDEGEVSGLGAVAEELDRGAVVDPLDKAENTHVRAAGRAVDRKVAYDADVELVEEVVAIRHDFRGFL